MIRFQLIIIGQNAVTNKLRTTAAKAPHAMGDITYRWAQGVRAKLKSTPYPPKRPGQRYVRTGRLANSWSAVRMSQSTVRIANSAGYSGYVVGKKQAWFHRGRWWTAQSVIGENRPELRAAVIKELDKMLK